MVGVDTYVGLPSHIEREIAYALRHHLVKCHPGCGGLVHSKYDGCYGWYDEEQQKLTRLGYRTVLSLL